MILLLLARPSAVSWAGGSRRVAPHRRARASGWTGRLCCSHSSHRRESRNRTFCTCSRTAAACLTLSAAALAAPAAGCVTTRCVEDSRGSWSSFASLPSYKTLPYKSMEQVRREWQEASVARSKPLALMMTETMEGAGGNEGYFPHSGCECW